MSHLIVMTTMPDMASAQLLADNLIENSLAACVNILPAMQSIYRWQGERQQGTEHQLIIKTCAHRYREIENFIGKHHPYELPEIIGLPIQHGLTGYLSWITENCEKN
jgi:periplasmic divalent cation tolerance protein